MTWFHDVPESLLCVFIVGAFVTVALVGMLASRKHLRKAVHDRREHNDLVGFFLAGISVFNGLLLGLVAVAAWENHAEAEGLVAREATYLAALYRDVGDYPAPAGGELQGLIAEYARLVIENEWQQQRRGIVPADGVAHAEEPEKRLTQFEPTDQAQAVLHAEAMREFNVFYEARRLRLGAIESRLPETLWWVMILGGLLTIAVCWMFDFAHSKVQLLLTASIAAMIGLLVFISAAMDAPFRGKAGIGPEPFKLVSGQLME
jgi:hypothetical protein